MKKLKVLKSLILVIFCMFFLCGCATIEHFRYYDKEFGSVTDIISIVLDTNKIPASKLEVLDAEIKADMQEYKEIAEQVDGVCEVILHENGSYAYGVETKFTSVYAMEKLFGSDIGPFSTFLANKQKIWAEEYTPFFYKYQPDESNSILWAIKYQNGLDGETFYNKYYEIVTGEQATAEAYSTEYLDIYQTFMTNVKDIHTNADKVESDGTNIKFTWNLSDKPLDYQVEIYGLRARTSMWYLVAIIFVSVLAIILIVVAVVLDIRKEKLAKVQNVEKLENIDNKNEEKPKSNKGKDKK